MAEETHFGKKVLLTRKGAVYAGLDTYVIIPGSMGARTYIARGLGSVHSFQSCSHGAGRAMSRTEATKRFTVADHEKATEGVECHKGADLAIKWFEQRPKRHQDPKTGRWVQVGQTKDKIIADKLKQMKEK